MRFAEIENGLVRHVGEAPFLPVFSESSGLHAVDLAVAPMGVGEGWSWSPINGFGPPSNAGGDPRLMVQLSLIGPDSQRGFIRGHDATVVFRVDERLGTPLNGVIAAFQATVGGKRLDGCDGRPSFDQTFRLPVQPVDAWDKPSGPAVHLLVEFKAGAGTVEFRPEGPLCYLVTQESIAQRLEPGETLELITPIRIVGVR